MLFRSILVALAAAATVAALPWQSQPVQRQARAVTPTGRKKYLGAKFSPKTTAANAPKRAKGKGNGGAGNAGAGNAGAGNAGAGNNNNGTANAVGDTGILDVIEMCENPDGKTSCFEILGDSKDSCFTIPNPIANNVQFFTPAPNDTCTLFSDEDCTQNATPAAGVIKNAKQNSWACTPIAAAAAAA